MNVGKVNIWRLYLYDVDSMIEVRRTVLADTFNLTVRSCSTTPHNYGKMTHIKVSHIFPLVRIKSNHAVFLTNDTENVVKIQPKYRIFKNCVVKFFSVIYEVAKQKKIHTTHTTLFSKNFQEKNFCQIRVVL